MGGNPVLTFVAVGIPSAAVAWVVTYSAIRRRQRWWAEDVELAKTAETDGTEIDAMIAQAERYQRRREKSGLAWVAAAAALGVVFVVSELLHLVAGG